MINYIGGLSMIYAYIRVSTDKQYMDNQYFEITEFAKRENIHIDKFISEEVSGAKDYHNRNLGKLLKKCKKDDILICSELSRLGRSLFMIMDILSLCLSNGTQVWTIKENYRLGDDISSKVLAFAFALSSEIERKLISERTKEALKRVKNEGKILGRPPGSKNKSYKLDGKDIYIDKLLAKGFKKKQIAKKLKIHPNTLYIYLKNRNAL